MKLRLTLNVEYDEDDVDPLEFKRELADNLDRMVQHAAGEGHFTGDSPCTVNSWEHSIELIECPFSH